MKSSHFILITMAAGWLLLGAGCHKPEAAERQSLGQQVSFTEFREAFAKASDNDIPALVNGVATDVHHGEYTSALTTLQRLANHPGLTAQQKKVTSKVLSQVEQLAANSRPK